MVTQQPERKSDADYSLARVHQLARGQSISYATTKVQCQVTDLGYGLAEVCACILDLRDSDLSHSERYRPGGIWHDVYKTRWGLTGKSRDDLYIKFRMDRDLLIIELCSFHLQR